MISDMVYEKWDFVISYKCLFRSLQIFSRRALNNFEAQVPIEIYIHRLSFASIPSKKLSYVAENISLSAANSVTRIL